MNRNLEALDALRGLAALAVAFSAWSVFTIWHGSEVAARMALFLDFFFVFTGFLIAEVYRDQIRTAADLGRFAILRLARLYPIHLFFLAPLAGVELMKLFYAVLGADTGGTGAFAAAHLSLEGLLANITLTQAFGFVENPGWNEPSWYVAVEFWISLGFAALCMCGVLARAWGRAALGVLCFGALIWMALTASNLAEGGYFMRGLYAFGVGVGVQSVMRMDGVARRLAEWRSSFGGSMEVIALITAVAAVIYSADVLSFAAPIVFGLLLFVFVDGRGFVSRTLRTGPFRLIGKFAYSIYMSHFLFILPMRGIVETDGAEAAMLPATFAVGAYLGLTLVLGIITERLVEEPTRDHVRRWLEGRSWARTERERAASA